LYSLFFAGAATAVVSAIIQIRKDITTTTTVTIIWPYKQTQFISFLFYFKLLKSVDITAITEPHVIKL
jgi:hypothetical protein